MHEDMRWYNDNIQFMFHANIVEYDIAAASLAVSERYDLLDKNTIEQLRLLPKENRTVRIGLIQRENKEFSKQLLSGIREIRRKFIEINNLDETNILSLHSDACIFSSKKKIITNIEGVEFKHKNTWSGYIRYKDIEMFYVDNYITYKGIPEAILNQHTLGINRYLVNVFDKIEDYDSDILKYLSKFQTSYLQDKLQNYFYIPFGRRGGTYKMSNLELFSFIANIILKEVREW
jgi:hypothetical protein